MYASKTKTPVGAADFERSEDARQIAYWCKPPNFHSRMKQPYDAKGGTQERFNCTGLRLNAADLDELEAALNENGLPDCFGDSGPDRIDNDRAFITSACAASNEGYFVYDDWW